MLLEEHRRGLAEAAQQLFDAYGDGGVPTPLRFDALSAASEVPRIGAVDGGSCVLVDVVSCGCVAVRSTSTVRGPSDAHTDGPVHERVAVVTRRDPESWWRRLVVEFGWGQAPTLPPPRGRGTMASWADAARTLLEYHAARSVVRELGEGDVLLLDGALEEESHGLGLVPSLLVRAAERGVHLAAVSKDSSRSINGLLPFTLEVEEAAVGARAPARFACDVTPALGLDGQGFRTFGARWDAAAPVFRVDVAAAPGTDPRQVLELVAASCNDPTVPGYPYPLARAHGRIRFGGDAVVDLRRAMEAMVAERRGSRASMRLFGRGRDLLDLGS